MSNENCLHTFCTPRFVAARSSDSAYLIHLQSIVNISCVLVNGD